MRKALVAGQPAPGLPRFEAILFLLAATGLILGSVLDWSVLHPGYVTYDDEALLSQIQAAREGASLPWGLGIGSFFRRLVLVCVQLFGPGLGSAQVPALGLALAEMALLAAWGARLGSPRAGVWAALIALSAASTWVRSRALLSFAAVPAELCLALWVLPERGKGPLRAALTGAGLSLLILDYELWAGGLALLYVFWLFSQRPRAEEALAALGSGLLCLLALAWLTGFDLGAYAQVRLAHSAPLPGDGAWQRAFNGLFKVPSQTLSFMAAAKVAWAPRWLWLPALLGAYSLGRRGLPWLGLLGLGLVPVLARSPWPEPQRLLLAWPPLCLLAAFGFERLCSRGTWLPRAAALALALSAVPAWAAFQRSQEANAASAYGAAANRLSAVRDLEAALQGQPVQVLSDLDLAEGQLLRFHLDASRLKQGPGVTAVPVPWEFVPQGQDPAWGRWVGTEGAVPALPGQYWVLDPPPGRLKAWRAEAALLAPFWRAHALARDERQRRAAAEALLDAKPGPWARTIAATHWLSASRQLAEAPPERLRSILAGPLLGGQVQQEAAEFLAGRDPAWALSLAEAACKADPRRLEAWQLWEGLLRSQGRPQEAEAVSRRLRELLAHQARPGYDSGRGHSGR